MTVKKSLQQRETELQALLATPTGKNELQEMAARYTAAGARLRPGRLSVVTYILVYEREHGRIDG